MYQELMTNERHEFLEPNEPYFPFPSKEQDETNYTNDVFPFFNGYMPSYLDDNMNLEEFKIKSAFENIFPSYKPEKSKIFKVEYRQRISLFSMMENIEDDSSANDDTFLRRKRYKVKRKRRENQDNMRKKIKRRFLNFALVGNINEILKNIDKALYLEKFPSNFVSDITKRSNKNLLNMTLQEIFEKKELYEENGLKNYYHNLKVIKSEQIQKNIDLKEILNKKYPELFKEYINSKEFKIDEINRLKKNKMQDDYIKRYIYLAKNFIEFFSE